MCVFALTLGATSAYMRGDGERVRKVLSAPPLMRVRRRLYDGRRRNAPPADARLTAN